MSADCGDGHHDHGHDHDHAADGQFGPQDNLFAHIDVQNVVALNASAPGSKIIKSWASRMDESESLESDADDQMIIRIPLVGSAKLRALLLKTGPADQTPEKVLLFANENNLDFDDVLEKKPSQEFAIPQGRDVGEYTLKSGKFSHVSSVTLFFPAAQGADTVQIYYIGLLGQWSEHKEQPVITVYETQANIADHEKIRGTEGNFNNLGS